MPKRSRSREELAVAGGVDLSVALAPRPSPLCVLPSCRGCDWALFWVSLRACGSKVLVWHLTHRCLCRTIGLLVSVAVTSFSCQYWLVFFRCRWRSVLPRFFCVLAASTFFLLCCFLCCGVGRCLPELGCSVGRFARSPWSATWRGSHSARALVLFVIRTLLLAGSVVKTWTKQAKHPPPHDTDVERLFGPSACRLVCRPPPGQEHRGKGHVLLPICIQRPLLGASSSAFGGQPLSQPSRRDVAPRHRRCCSPVSRCRGCIVQPWLCGATSTALRRRPDCRSISLGETIRRLTAQVFLLDVGAATGARGRHSPPRGRGSIRTSARLGVVWPPLT